MSIEVISRKREDGETVSILFDEVDKKFEVPVNTGDNETDDTREVYCCQCPFQALDAFFLECGMNHNIFNLTYVIVRMEYAFEEHPQQVIFTAALARVQDYLGQDEGDFAGVYFTEGEKWQAADIQWRVKNLAEYISSEICMFGGQADD